MDEKGNTHIEINIGEISVSSGGQLNIAGDGGRVEAAQNNFESETYKDSAQTVVEIMNGILCRRNLEAETDLEPATEEDVSCIPDEIIEEYRKQLGTRLRGNETRLQIVGKFLSEMDATLQSGKRYGVMSVFTQVPRQVGKGYLVLDDCVMPYDCVEIQEYYWDAYEKYVIDDTYYHLAVVLHAGQEVYLEFGYTLCFPDVTERLYGFRKAKQVEQAKKVSLLLSDNRKIDIRMTLFANEDRKRQAALTDYWIEQMQMIDEIERFYKIKFHLPKKASEEDYQSIYVIYNAIHKWQTTTFPPLEAEKPFLQKTIEIKEDVFINDGSSFRQLDLFGYHFTPVSAYLMACTLIWKKKMKAWETAGGGVPVRVEFMCSRG